jgi:predicted transcriptional regulator
MPIGVVTDSEFEIELFRSKIPIQKKDLEIKGKVKDKVIPGRREGDVEVPESLRKLIGAESIENGRGSALELAKSLGISSSSVSAYSNGATGTTSYNEGNKELRSHINSAKDRIVKKARSRLFSALHNITPEKLADAKLKDVSSVAKDMSAIIKNMEPSESERGDKDGKPVVNIVLYAPRMRNEGEYEVITVNE